jgi:hypothetical protein
MDERMAPRDPIKTSRNRIADEITDSLRKMLPTVLSETGIEKESSLNAIIGGKCAHFIDLHHEVILSPDAFASLYMKGFKSSMSPAGLKFPNSNRRNYEMFRASKAAQEYFMLFFEESLPSAF